MEVLLELDISTSNAAILNEGDVGSTVDFLDKVAENATQVLSSFAWYAAASSFMKKDQAIFETLQISSQNFALTVSVADHVSVYLNTTVRSNVSLNFGINILTSLTTLAFKIELVDQSAEIKIITRNIASQVRIQKKAILFVLHERSVETKQTIIFW